MRSLKASPPPRSSRSKNTSCPSVSSTRHTRSARARSSLAYERNTSMASPPRFDEHRHAESGAQRDEGPRLDAVARHQAQAIPLRKRGHDEVRFHQRELVADALARP